MAAYVIADVQVTDPAGYEPYRPLAAASIARFGGRLSCAAATLTCSKAPPSRSGSSSSNSPTLKRRGAGTNPTSINPR